MKKIFFVVLALVLFSDFAKARFGGVRISRSFSRPSISRNYSRSATRSSAKPVVKTSTPKASQIKKQVAERPQKENPGHQASSGNLLPWIFYGHTISRSQSNGKISCDCSSLKDKSELYQECLRQCPKSKKINSFYEDKK